MNKSFYENTREQNINLVVRKDGNYTFAEHFHINIEILVAKNGKYQVSCNGKDYVAKAGSVVFIDSYDIHGYGLTGEERAGDIMLIIPYKFLERFNSFRKKEKVSCPIINDQKLVEDIVTIVDTFLINENTTEVVGAGIDMILALIEQKLNYSKTMGGDDSVLIKKILQFIEKNFKEDVSLDAIAKALGYTKEHLSRTFHKCLKQSVPTYVNRLRLQYIANDSSNKPLNELIYEAGFNSVSTYYRVKKNLV